MPVARPRDHDHRLGEQREREGDRDYEPEATPAVEARGSRRRRRRRTRRRRRRAPSCQPSSCSCASGVSSGGSAASDTTAQAARAPPSPPSSSGAARSTAGPARRRARATSNAANPEATTSPTGVASSKPAFFPSRTPGVASAWSPRKPALARHASETRNRRASRRRRPAAEDGPAHDDARAPPPEHRPEVGRMALPDAVRAGLTSSNANAPSGSTTAAIHQLRAPASPGLAAAAVPFALLEAICSRGSGR